MKTPVSCIGFPMLLVLIAALAGPPNVHAAESPTRVRVAATHTELAAAIGAETVSEDYGQMQWLTVDSAALGRLHTSGLQFSEVDEPFTLDLGGARFDPLSSGDHAPSRWNTAASGDIADWRLVQFTGPVRQKWLDALREVELEPVQYIHPFTYVVWGKPGALDRAATQQQVRWTGNFLPAYRVLPRWRSLTSARTTVRATVHRGMDLAQTTRGIAANILAQRDIDRSFSSVELEVAGDRLAQLAQVPGVYSIQPVPTDGGLRGEMSDQINAGNYGSDDLAFPGYRAYLDGIGIDGDGVTMANVDGGIYDMHPDLVNRMLPCSGPTCGGSATDSHGTHTAAIMAGDGTSGTQTSNGFLRGLGMAPGANLIEQLYSPTFTQPGGMLKLMTESVRNDAVLSGNSWGPAGSPRGYDDDTRQVDVGARDADSAAIGDQPLLYVLSFMNGNGGYQSQGSPDEAKNIFTIGSTKMQSSATMQYAAIDDLSSNTAHGPALDGRSIPAMVAPGCSVDSAVSATGYGLMCGTSMASPHVAGAAGLFFEYYRNLTGDDPSPALIKASFTAVAKDLTGNHDADGGILQHLFDSKQGWGRMRIDPVLAPAYAVAYIDQTVIFDNTGENWTQDWHAADPAQPMRLMLAWTDAPGHGLGGSTPAWNNNLDLRVTAGSQTWLGNVLGTDGWSETGGSADAKNNTEAVFLQPAQHGGSIHVEVAATDINSDGLPNAGDDTDQDFALVCYNCTDADAAVADVGVTAVADRVLAEPGAPISYSIEVSSSGPDPASGITVTATIPGVAPIGLASGENWQCNSFGADPICRLSVDLAASTTATFVLEGTLTATPPDPLVATFVVSADQIDGEAGNDSVVVATPLLLDRIFANDFEQPVAP